MQDTWEQTIPCRDFAGREKLARIAVSDDATVVLVVPPGGSASWHPGDIPQLQQILTGAQMEAVDRRDGGR